MGNGLGGDDAAGHCLMDMPNSALSRLSAGQHKAQVLHSQGITIMDAGTAPESYASVIRQHMPGLLILADAADMRLPPAALRKIPPERISTVSFPTHDMPLALFISYVNEFGGKVPPIEVRPERTQMGRHPSEVVRRRVMEFVEAILEGRVPEIPLLRQAN